MDENQDSEQVNYGNKNQQIRYVGFPVYTPYSHQQTAQENQQPQYTIQPPPPQHYTHLQPKTISNPHPQPNSANYTTNPLIPNNQYFFKTF